MKPLMLKRLGNEHIDENATIARAHEMFKVNWNSIIIKLLTLKNLTFSLFARAY